MLSTAHHIHINNHVATKDGVPLLSLREGERLTAEEFYRVINCSYPKFFKMDLLCKWGWLAAEWLLKKDDGFVYEGLDKNKIAMALYTKTGCLEVDKRYQETLSEIPSPALFVYTLSNIMLGEICIRHGFKGEQICMIQDSFSKEEMMFWVADKMKQEHTEACICGWVDVSGENKEMELFWIVKERADFLES